MSSWRTTGFVIGLRGIGRLLKVNRYLHKLIASPKYEKEFDDALLQTIRSGDCVWDVGANVGLYTDKFLRAIAGGDVIAFEPAPGTFRLLKERFMRDTRVVCLPIALGRETKGTSHNPILWILLLELALRLM